MARRCIQLTHPAVAILSPAAKVARDRALAELRAAGIAQRKAERDADRLELRVAREVVEAERRASDPNRCQVCGARIVNRLSVDRGVGPVCFARGNHS